MTKILEFLMLIAVITKELRLQNVFGPTLIDEYSLGMVLVTLVD